MLRIVAGRHRGRRLAAPEGQVTRPTAERVRQALFDMLWHAPWAGRAAVEEARVLDAFAGTGALGLEAASRGAAAVSLVEQDPALCKSLQATVQRLDATASVRVERGDGVAALRQRGGQGLDLVFLDPPFGEDGNEALFQAALQAARQAVADPGLVYLEAPRAWDADGLARLGLQVHRHGKAGMVHFHLLQPLPPQ